MGAEWKQGDPGPRLLQVAGLLTAAASTSSAAAMAAMAASVVQSIMFTSVCRGFISGQGHNADTDLPEACGTTEVHFLDPFLTHALIALGHAKFQLSLL